MAQYDKEHCCLCLEQFSDRPTQQVLLKDVNNLIRKSEEQEKIDLADYLKNFKQSDEVLYIHKNSRRKFTELDASQQYQFQLLFHLSLNT